MASLIGTVCTDLVVYQPFLAGFLLYNLTGAGYAVYSVGSAIFTILGAAGSIGKTVVVYTYNKATGKEEDEKQDT